MSYVKMITGEIIHVAEKTAERVHNNRSSLHVDKATGIRFAGEHVVLIYPDEYDLVPTVEKLPDLDEFKNVGLMSISDKSLNPDPIAGNKPMTVDELNGESRLGALPEKAEAKKSPGRPKKK